MSAPRMVRCCECDRPLAAYGPADDDEPLCAACADRDEALPAMRATPAQQQPTERQA